MLEEAPVTVEPPVDRLGVGAKENPNPILDLSHVLFELHSVAFKVPDVNQKMEMRWHETVRDGIKKVPKVLLIFAEKIRETFPFLEYHLVIV